MSLKKTKQKNINQSDDVTLSLWALKVSLHPPQVMSHMKNWHDMSCFDLV